MKLANTRGVHGAVREHAQPFPRSGPLREPGRFSPAEPGLDTVLRLQRDAGNQAVAGWLAPALTELGQLVRDGERLLLEAVRSGEAVGENSLTDALFWLEHPRLRGAKLRAGTPAALRWLQLRDVVVRPLLRPRTGGGHQGGAASTGAAIQPPGLQPAAQIAAESTAGARGQAAGATKAGASKAGTGDHYFTQDVGHYQDVNDAGKPRVWLYGSSGANVCNMTSLTMSLVSLAGEAEVRAKMIGHLRASGMHAGASVQVGGQWVPLAGALDDPKIAPRIETLDLVTAVAIGTHGGYGDVTLASTIARVARETGLATAETATGPVHLADREVRAAAAQLLAQGTRVIAGTVNHYVYLVEVRDDGVVVHDPAGARVTPGLTRPIFLHAGAAGKIAREFLSMDGERRATAVRRVATNPPAAAVVHELPRIATLSEADRATALRALADAHPEHIATGALNFYANDEFAANDLRLRVTLSAAKA